jgi:hypothetical protein
VAAAAIPTIIIVVVVVVLVMVVADASPLDDVAAIFAIIVKQCNPVYL